MQPAKVEPFLIEQLKLKKKQGPRCTIYSESELENIFKLFDLRENGHISKEQCKKALSTIAHSEYHYKKIQDKDIPDKVDVKTFLKLWYFVDFFIFCKGGGRIQKNNFIKIVTRFWV